MSGGFASEQSDSDKASEQEKKQTTEQSQQKACADRFFDDIPQFISVFGCLKFCDRREQHDRNRAR